MGQLLKTLNADIVISTFGTETYILPKMVI